ncbi:hypothetical protein RKD47_000110 [Streptomyces albogriseolus]
MPGTEIAYLRYVALGDSQTEGVGDGDDVTGLRGFADRLAEHLARHEPALQYANLAVRGRLAGQIHTEQLAPALALRPDLATVVAGVNDLLRPGFDADEVCTHLDAMFGALTGQGALVATITVPDLSRVCPVARPLVPRVTALNEGIRRTARPPRSRRRGDGPPPGRGRPPPVEPRPPPRRPPGARTHRRRPRPRPAAARQRRHLDPPPPSPGPAHRSARRRHRNPLAGGLPGTLAAPPPQGPLVRRRPLGQTPAAPPGPGRPPPRDGRLTGGTPALTCSRRVPPCRPATW